MDKFKNNLDLIAIPVVLLVFLFYNWQPAKVFMGDAGSTFLGALVTALVLNSMNLENSFSVKL